MSTNHTTAEQHLSYAAVALIVGFFLLGVICGPIAAYHGYQAAQKGSGNMGYALMWLGIAEAVVTGAVLLGIV
jgi:hypothetical protein